eukprot:403360631
MSDILANQKFIYTDDNRVRHQGTLTIKDEDHSLGNLVRQQLLHNPKVKFSGYRKPHPLEEYVEIKVQTTGEVSPPDSIIMASEQLLSQMKSLSDSLMKQAQLLRVMDNSNTYPN